MLRWELEHEKASSFSQIESEEYREHCISMLVEYDESKRRCVQSIKQRSTEPGWPPLLVFPEGTCTNGSALVNFKPGAFSAGVGWGFIYD